jgi:hypothetical protein
MSLNESEELRGARKVALWHLFPHVRDASAADRARIRRVAVVEQQSSNLGGLCSFPTGPVSEHS